MSAILKRPDTKIEPSAGVLRCEYFQTAYVTSDVDQACDVFTRRYGIRAYHDIDTSFANGSSMRVRLAWVGGHMIEIIESKGPGMEFYNDRLPPEGFAIRHHHLGYLLPDEAAWADLEAEIARSGWTVVMDENMQGFLWMKYLQAPELDHYMEFFLLGPGGTAMFEAVPAS